MNATVLQTRVDDIVDRYGNSIVYHSPILTDGTTYWTDEGDWKYVYDATTTGSNSKMIESNTKYSNQFSKSSLFDLKEGQVILKGSFSVVRRGKIVANSINWEITEIEPIRVKDVLVAQIVTLKNIVP